MIQLIQFLRGFVVTPGLIPLWYFLLPITA